MVETRQPPLARSSSAQEIIIDQLSTTAESLDLLAERQLGFMGRQSEIADRQSNMTELQSEFMMRLGSQEINTSEKFAVKQTNPVTRLWLLPVRQSWAYVNTRNW